ncbi:hypothetical protein VNI00_013947 [Paramarasmius palmivorus]|uniref:Uncharacterized protein n=1 Tax=Paramarasmius palmivorus TaxID=297713 RepID=A0AAW0C038_9AGAR
MDVQNEISYGLLEPLPSTKTIPSEPDGMSRWALFAVLVVVVEMEADHPSFEWFKKTWPLLHSKLSLLLKAYILPLTQFPTTQERYSFHDSLVFACSRLLIIISDIKCHYSAQEQSRFLDMEPTFIPLMTEAALHLAHIHCPHFEFVLMHLLKIGIPHTPELLDLFQRYTMPNTCISILSEALAKSDGTFDACVVRATLALASTAFVSTYFVSPTLVLPENTMTTLFIVMDRLQKSMVNAVPSETDLVIFCETFMFCCGSITACFYRSFGWVGKALDQQLFLKLVEMEAFFNSIEITPEVREKLLAWPPTGAFCDLVSCIRPFLVLRPVVNKILKYTDPLLSKASTTDSPLMDAISQLNKEAWSIKRQMYQFDDGDMQSCSHYQRAQWKLGHREECKAIRPDIGGPGLGVRVVSFQDEQFIKYLVRREIVTRIDHLRREASSKPILVRFDYREWPMSFSCIQLSSSTLICICETNCDLQKYLQLLLRQLQPKQQVVVQIYLRSQPACNMRWVYVEGLPGRSDSQ